MGLPQTFARSFRSPGPRFEQAAFERRWGWLLAGGVICSTGVTRLAEGKNYCIDDEEGLIVCRVWKRPDLRLAEGSALAAELAEWFAKLARDRNWAMLFDLSKAPEVVGPETQQSLEVMLSAWEGAQKPLAIVCGSASVQRLQLSRLAGQAAPRLGSVFTSEDQARAWLRTREA